MPLRRRKHNFENHQTMEVNSHPRLCPKTSKFGKHSRKYPWLIWLFPVAGLLSLVWFLIRVIPKPSRATYPCQRVAAPFASGFIIWLAGLIGSTFAYRKAKHLFHCSRYILAVICIAVSVMVIWWSFSVTAEVPAEAAFTPSDLPNSPIGEAKGIFPGRVVWFHDPAATNWDGSTGNWWDEGNTDQNVVDCMVSKSIQTLTGQSNDTDAWDALFRHFNQTKGFGDIGYQQGEKIAVKINMNQDRTGGTWGKSSGMPSPQVIYAFLEQLIYKADVPGSAITVYDATRYVGDPIFNKVRSNPDPNFQSITFVVIPSLARNGRVAAIYDVSNPLYTKAGTAYLPRCVTVAKYLINMALLRAHTMFGVTVCAKNHFGSVYFPSGGGWTPAPLHGYGGRGMPMNSYNCLVNLNGHRHLSGKTLLYMIDGLYPAEHNEANVIRYLSFGDNWASSLFLSQDPVAIDSVAMDFLRNEARCTNVTGNPDNYLHEMALANNPPSGTFYDPERDGTPLASLGVHEHWNNPFDKKYSRNLGIGNGIELVTPSLTSTDGPVKNTTTGERYDYIRYAVSDANSGDTIVVSPGVYYDNINLSGKNLTIMSTDPNDPAIVENTVICGSNQAVTFAGSEDANCVLIGLTITGANNGIYCSGASPTIINCKIMGNKSAGIKLWNQSNPTIVNCIVSGNSGAGIEMWASRTGRFIPYNYATITNCTIVGNFLQGIWGGKPTITNSIIYDNGRGCDSVQIVADEATVTYSNIQGSWPDEGNIDADPCFIQPQYLGPVSCWKFDEGGGTIAHDLVGQNHGNIYGAQWTTGIVDDALNFDGVYDYVKVPDRANLDLTTGFTLEAWICPASTTAPWDDIITKWGPPEQRSYSLTLSDGIPAVYISKDGTGTGEINATGCTGLSPGKWYHIVGTFDGDYLKIYLNRILDGSNPWSGAVFSGDAALVIGGADVWMTDPFHGIIDEVAIYNRALIAKEIQQLYQNGHNYPDVGNPDYHLQWDSPCINAGDPDFTAEVIQTDIDGEPRIIDGRVDIGCDEVAMSFR